MAPLCSPVYLLLARSPSEQPEPIIMPAGLTLLFAGPSCLTHWIVEPACVMQIRPGYRGDKRQRCQNCIKPPPPFPEPFLFFSSAGSIAYNGWILWTMFLVKANNWQAEPPVSFWVGVRMDPKQQQVKCCLWMQHPYDQADQVASVLLGFLLISLVMSLISTRKMSPAKGKY